MLLQRLGYSDNFLDSYVDKEGFYLHELKFNIRQAYIEKNYTKAKKLLDEYEQKISKPNSINEQFLILYTVLLNSDEYTVPQKLDMFENAIRLTYPKYRSDKIPHVLSYEEIVLINGIGLCHALNGKRAVAIDILFALKVYYEKRIVNTEESLRTQPMVLYNLSKCLGLEGRYDECIEICNLGIRIAKSTGRAAYLGQTLFNLSWALLQRNRLEDRENARVAATQAYYLVEIMGQHNSAELYRSFISDNFGENILL